METTKADLISQIVTQGDLPAKSEETPATPAAQPVTAGDLVSGDNPPPAVSPAQPVTPADLIGETPAPEDQSPSKPAQRALPPSLAAVEEKIGCQCERCKANPEKRDKRGRHHRICPCDTCKKQRGETVAAVPDFSDMTPEAAVTDYAAMSAMMFDSSTGILCMTFGPEWQPQSPQERDAVTQALATYLRAKQVKDIPPGVMLSIVILAYSAQRLKAPTTASKLQMAWTWFKTKFFKRRQSRLTVLATPDNNQQAQP